jgi:hypothetical protein
VKRKSREETGRAFRMTARKLMRRVARIPAEAYHRATAYLADTLDWLHHHDTLDCMNPYWDNSGDAIQDDFNQSEQNNLSLHL